MRVLYLEKFHGITSVAVSEIHDMGYEDDITCIKDENGYYDRFNDQPVEGLYMIDTDKNFHYFPNISQSKCEEICEEAFQKGFVDIRKYGAYMDNLDESEE